MKYFDRKHMVSAVAGILAGVLLMTGCTANETGVSKSGDSSDSSLTLVSDSVRQTGIYDSEDAAVVVKKDVENRTVQFQNISASRRYTLSYDGTTSLYDRNKQAITMEQLKEGSVVTVRFYKPDKSLVYVEENPDCISYTNIQNYDLDLNNGTITIGKNMYNISGHVVVVSDGREADMMEVNNVDVISVWGYKNMIYGINVEKGHGYLRLINEDYFVGGWLDVGDKVIKKISEDMLVVVPEGTYDVLVSSKGSSATQQITFARNEEMAWDLGDVEITIVQKGTIIFTLTPATAKVSIDGQEVDISKPVTLEYGLHQMRITADGYDTVAQYIKVAEPSANISVDLVKSEESETETETEETPEKEVETDSDEEQTTSKKYQSKSSDESESSDEKSSNETSSESESEKTSSSQVVSSTSKYKVYIDAPEGVEAYIDGNYVGITPVNFNKVEGSYVVTLRKTGYQTRSYTLQIDNEEKDVNYTFTELTKLEE
jgi:hypothetical protein